MLLSLRKEIPNLIYLKNVLTLGAHYNVPGLSVEGRVPTEWSRDLGDPY